MRFKLFEEYGGINGEAIFRYYGEDIIVLVENSKIVDIYTNVVQNNLQFSDIKWTRGEKGMNGKFWWHCKPEYWYKVLDELLHDKNSRLVVLDDEDEEMWDEFREVIEKEYEMLRDIKKFNL